MTSRTCSTSTPYSEVMRDFEETPIHLPTIMGLKV